jgi:phosphatidate cytidylyltransferase
MAYRDPSGGSGVDDAGSAASPSGGPGIVDDPHGDATGGAHVPAHGGAHGGAHGDAHGGDEALAADRPLRTAEPRVTRAERRRREEAEADARGRRPSRAGRNLPAAIGVGVGLGAIVLAALFFWPPAFLAVIIAAVVVAVWEMARAVRFEGAGAAESLASGPGTFAGGANPPLPPLIAGGVAMVVLAWFRGPAALTLGLFVTVLAALVWRLSDGPAGFQRDLGASALIVVYIPFLGGFAALLAASDDGGFRVLATLVAVVLSDTGGYAAGVRFGRHPMAPSVSPKKSWEGMAGSLAASAIGSAVLLYLLLDVAPWWGAVFGLVLSVAATFGDLAESMIKRDLGVKDMSDLLPGHGGLMDRLDSVLFALPAAYLLLSVLAPSG